MTVPSKLEVTLQAEAHRANCVRDFVKAMFRRLSGTVTTQQA